MNRKKLIFSSIIAAFVKAFAALIAFFMTLAITRLLGAEQAGLFLLAMSILSFSCVFFQLGLDNVIIRLISSSKGEVKSISAMNTGLIWSLLSTIVFVLIVLFNSRFFSSSLFSKPELHGPLSIMILGLPFMLVYLLLGFGFQAFYRVIAATVFQNLGHYMVFFILLGISYVFIGFNGPITAYDLSFIYVLSTVLICIAALIMWHRQIKGNWGVIQFKDKCLWERSSNLWAASIMSLMVQWSGLLIAGALVSSADIAFLTAAQRTAMLTSFVLMVVNMVVAPRYALLWKEGRLDEIQRLARWSTRCMLILVMPILAAMLIIPELIMGLFGADFTVAGNLLAIMAVGQFINVATGSVGFLLNMSGHERDFRRVTVFAGPLTIILSYYFIIQWGVLGAAIATSVGLSLQNIGALFMVRKRLGFWPIG